MSVQRYRQETQVKDTGQPKETDSVYESAEETTGYHELGEFHDIFNYDKLSWDIHEKTRGLVFCSVDIWIWIDDCSDKNISVPCLIFNTIIVYLEDNGLA